MSTDKKQECRDYHPYACSLFPRCPKNCKRKVTFAEFRNTGEFSKPAPEVKETSNG